MAQNITVTQGLRLDIVAAETMGTEQNGCLEALLGANQGLAAGGPYIAEGTTIVVPAAPPVPAAQTVNPWD
jgi:phage tail protein X